MQLLLKIKLFGEPYTICFLTSDYMFIENEKQCQDLHLCKDNVHIGLEDLPRFKCTKGMKNSALYLSCFMQECSKSSKFRNNVINKLCTAADSNQLCLKLNFLPPEKEILDYAWNERMLELIWSKIEIENAFSWLSTLGGAYSALGDYFQYCAEEAGRISQCQYKLSRLLGDEGLAARSKLYYALSYSQKGKLKLARHIVRDVADYAKVTKDKRLLRMCHGVWAKLNYLKAIKNGTLENVKCDGDNVSSQSGKC